MGLDMYLHAEKYVGNWKHSDEKERAAFGKVLEAVNLPASVSSESSPGMTVSVTVAYWRKANAIHAWFVDHVQRGKDECQNTYVPREKLEALVKACREEIETRGKSGSLSPRAGFFFGSTDKDEYYYEDLKYTVEQISGLLKNPDLDEWAFYYRSSW